MLKSMKKGGPKKKIKAEIIPYERKSSMPSKIAKGPSKEQREEGAATIKRVGREMQDTFEGRQEFGDDYEKLNLKLSALGLDKSDKENPQKVRYFKSKSGDEEVTREGNTQALRVRSLKKTRYPDEPEVFNESITERKSRFGFKTPEELKLEKTIADRNAETRRKDAIRVKEDEERKAAQARVRAAVINASPSGSYRSDYDKKTKKMLKKN
jgi:hypothetical protein